MSISTASLSRIPVLPLAAGLLAAAAFGAAPRDARGGVPATYPLQDQGPLVVNELDYRQPGVDNAEFVELLNVGSAPLNLADYNLLGIDSAGDEYRRDILPARLLSPGEYFVIGSAQADNVDLVVGSVDIWRDSGSHPGEAAAVAVVHNPGADQANEVLVDSVSYDGNVQGAHPNGGAWTETRGVAAGDDNVTALLGISRLPNGSDTDDNSADLSRRCITPGYANTTAAGQTAPCAAPATVTPSPTPDLGPGHLVINEFDYDQPNGGFDFVEILNASLEVVDLADYDLVAINGTQAVPFETRRDHLPARRLLPGEFFVAGNSLVPNLGLDLGRDDVWSGGGPMAIALVHNLTGLPEDDRLEDSLSYEGDVAGGPALGGTWTETAGADNDSPVEPFLALARFPDGNDTNVNALDFQLYCSTPGYDNLDDQGPCRAPGTVTPSPTATETQTSGTPTPSATATPTDDLITRTPTPTELPPGSDRFIVNSPEDTDDANPGDGRCADRDNRCTLRAALRELRIRPGQDPVRIEFSGPMDIRLVSGQPLLQVSRTGTLLTGSAHFRGGEPGVRILGGGVAAHGSADTFDDLLSRGLLGLGLHAHPRGSGMGLPSRPGAPTGAWDRPASMQTTEAIPFGLEIAGPVTVQGLYISGFDVGVRLSAVARRAVIGQDGDGLGDEQEGLVIEQNGAAGIALLTGSADNRLAGNSIRHNRGIGIGLWRTRAGGNLMSRNQITGNGGAAIAVHPLGHELAPPEIRGVDRSRGIAAGLACPDCLVEVFGDPADEAALYLASARADGVGLWQAPNIALDGIVNLTATATDQDGNTSRLSSPFPAQARWHLVDVTPLRQRLLDDGVLRRSLRVLDDRRRPVGGAALRFLPFGDSFVSDDQGRAEVEFDLRALLSSGESSLISLEGLSGPDPRSPGWVPNFVIGRGGVASLPGPPGELVIGGLGPRSLGATLIGRFGELTTAAASPDQSAEVYGAGMIVAPADLREGVGAWVSNLAQGGAIYAIQAASNDASGTLTITAPVEAHAGASPAAGCTESPAGAVIAGWNKDITCWNPIISSEVAAPEEGASTFAVSAGVTVPAAGSLFGSLQATGAYTMYTVGHDTLPPVITPTLGMLTPDQLPEFIAIAHDDLSGVDAGTGIRVLFDGVERAATYDPTTGFVRLEPGARQLPAEGGRLTIEATDGFCNEAAASVNVPPGGRWRAFLPVVYQR